MTRLDEHLARALARIYEADGGAYSTFQPIFAHLPDRPIAVRPPINGIEDLLVGPMRALAEKGFIELDPGTHRKLFGTFRLTDAGRSLAAQAASRGTIRDRFDSSWAAMTRILDATVEAWERAGGLDPVPFDDVVALLENDSRAQVAAGLQILRRDDLVELVEEGGNPEPLEVEPTPEALRRTGDWPSHDPDAIVRQLDRALAAAADATDDPAEKRRLETLREDAKDVGKGALAGAMVAVGKWLTGT